MAYNVKFLKGTQANFDALKTAGTLDKNTFYYVDETDLYLGSILLSSEEDVKNAVARIETNESDIATIKAELDAMTGGESGAGSITTQISNLRTELLEKINNNTGLIEAEEDRATKAEAALGGRIDTVALTADQANDQANENKTAIEGIQSSIEGLDELKTTVSNHTTQIDTLIGEDTGLSARAIALNELTKQLVPETAQESLDTLQEIAAWIQAHPGDVATMNEAIQRNASDITSLTSRVSANETNIQSAQELLNTVKELAEGNEDDIASINELLASITNETNGILAQSKGYTNSSIEALALGTASKKNVEDFDAAGSAAAALDSAKAYTNEALTWGDIVTE